jgi:5'-methylthioadenosine phosphorylase
MFALIGGSGLARLTALEGARRQVMRTPYGEPSGAFTLGRLAGRDIVFLGRHGAAHSLAPHEINYRANIWALAELGVTQIFALGSVGAIREGLDPPALVLPDQILDNTHGREATFFEGGHEPVTHVDFTWPYSSALRAQLLSAAAACGETLLDGGVYACSQGPRLETAAEIARLVRDGADVVGMTGMPEAALAREKGLAYACLAIVVNHAAGRGGSRTQIDLSGLQQALQEGVARALKVVESALAQANNAPAGTAGALETGTAGAAGAAFVGARGAVGAVGAVGSVGGVPQQHAVPAQAQVVRSGAQQ